MICDICQGIKYPRQCRNSAAFRQRHGAPGPCPYGIPLNNLPIGDNAPPAGGTGVSPVGTHGLEAHATCVHARPYRKCGGCAVCGRDEEVVRVVKRAECATCQFREEPALAFGG